MTNDEWHDEYDNCIEKTIKKLKRVEAFLLFCLIVMALNAFVQVAVLIAGYINGHE